MNMFTNNKRSNARTTNASILAVDACASQHSATTGTLSNKEAGRVRTAHSLLKLRIPNGVGAVSDAVDVPSGRCK